MPIRPRRAPINATVADSSPQDVSVDVSKSALVRVEPRNDEYVLMDVAAGRFSFLRQIFDGFECAVLHAWVRRERLELGFDRASCEGLITGLVECDGRTVAVAWSDFRIKAGSFSRANAQRLTAFLRHLRERDERVPLVFVVESAGLSLMEGRAAFTDVFSIWPELLRYAEAHPVFTCAVGRCLGIAPILFGLGHYRIAVAGRTQINLTGPEVIKLFFGTTLSFDECAAAERCVERHDLVHEMVASVPAALATIRGLLSPASGPEWPAIDAKSAQILHAIFDSPPRELIPGMCPRLRLFIGSRGGRPMGLFINPLGRSNNMITVRTLEKYAAGLDLFRAMRLPILSVLDSPGIDPRFDQGDAGLIRKILWVGQKIIRYPYGTLGVVAGRGFGGANTLGFPKVFGGSRLIALRGAQFGVMHERIVEQVLKQSPRLLSQWRETATAQGSGLEDLIAQGAVDEVVDVASLPREVEQFLEYAASRWSVPLRQQSGSSTRGRSAPRMSGRKQAATSK